MDICAGSIAARYAQLGGAVVFAGKPEAAIYHEERDQIDEIASRKVPKSGLLAVGDELPMDIKGAADTGFDACSIAGGIHADDLGDMNIAANVVANTKRIERQYASITLVGMSDRLRWT